MGACGGHGGQSPRPRAALWVANGIPGRSGQPLRGLSDGRRAGQEAFEFVEGPAAMGADRRIGVGERGRGLEQGLNPAQRLASLGADERRGRLVRGEVHQTPEEERLEG